MTDTNYSPHPKYQYIAWVPCVSGNLFFDKTSTSGNGKNYINANYIENDNGIKIRNILLASEKDWKDFDVDEDNDISGKNQSKGYFKNRGVWHVTLISTAAYDADSIEGSIYLINKNGRLWESLGMKEKLNYIRDQIKSKEDIKESVANIKRLLEDSKQAENIFISNFKLDSSGLVHLSYQNNCTSDQDTPFIVCRQSYYYVKYAFHVHKHHDDAESLTTIYPNSDQKNLAKLLINDLKRGLVTLNRNFHISEDKKFFAAKGIVSYAKSLALTCLREGMLTKKQYDAEKSYIDNIAESLEVTGRSLQTKRANLQTSHTNARSIGLLILASIAPFTLIFKDDIKKTLGSKHSDPPSWVIDVIVWSLTGTHAMYILLAIFMMYFLFISPDQNKTFQSYWGKFNKVRTNLYVKHPKRLMVITVALIIIVLCCYT